MQRVKEIAVIAIVLFSTTLFGQGKKDIIYQNPFKKGTEEHTKYNLVEINIKDKNVPSTKKAFFDISKKCADLDSLYNESNVNLSTCSKELEILKSTQSKTGETNSISISAIEKDIKDSLLKVFSLPKDDPSFKDKATYLLYTVKRYAKIINVEQSQIDSIKERLVDLKIVENKYESLVKEALLNKNINFVKRLDNLIERYDDNPVQRAFFRQKKKELGFQ